MEKSKLSQELESALSIIEKNISERNEMISVFEALYKSFYKFCSTTKYSESKPKTQTSDSSTNTEFIKLTLCSYRVFKTEISFIEKKLPLKPSSKSSPKIDPLPKYDKFKYTKPSTLKNKINLSK